MTDPKDIIESTVKTTVNDIINKVMSEIKQKNSSSLQSKIYRDEPILMPASGLPSYVPDEIREMQKLASSHDAYTHSEQWLFYTQGKFMENYEDDFEFKGEFVKYFPTYRSMNVRPLRGFFSWRTKVRRGEIVPAPLSFVFMYIYELINMIGVAAAEEGFAKLRELQAAYKEIDPSVDRHIRRWLVDYVIYYNLDKALLDNDAEFRRDEALITLIHRGEHDSDEVFAAIAVLSSYNIEKSKLYKQYPEDVKRVVCGVYAALEEYYGKHGKKSLTEKLFGVMFTSTYNMFETAVFYDRLKFSGYEYVMTDIRRYKRSNGAWSCERYIGGKSSRLGDIIKTIDAAMRIKYNLPETIKTEGTTKLLSSVIDREITALLEEKKRNERPEVKIDVRLLGSIRKASDITKSRLIVEDEAEKEQGEDVQLDIFTAVRDAAPAAAAPLLITPVVSTPRGDLPLDSAECEFLRCLLNGEPFDGAAAASGRMLSVIADAVNEKLFDAFADTVIVFEGDTPVLIEDYTEELKGLIGE